MISLVSLRDEIASLFGSKTCSIDPPKSYIIKPQLLEVYLSDHHNSPKLAGSSIIKFKSGIVRIRAYSKQHSAIYWFEIKITEDDRVFLTSQDLVRKKLFDFGSYDEAVLQIARLVEQLIEVKDFDNDTAVSIIFAFFK